MALALALPCALAACAEELERPPTLPALTATPSVSPSPPATSTALDAPTREGASAFARNWYTQLEAAYASKDPSLLEPLSAIGCEACTAFMESIAQLKRDGGRVEGLSYQLRAAEARPFEGDAAVVDIVYDSPETVSYDSFGAVDLREPAVMFAEESMRLTRSSGAWRVADIEPA
jgi:hypothetical protein